MIMCEHITGKHIGKKVFLFRVIFELTDGSMPFRFKRTQFPVRVSFAMTINKSQGQSFDRVGVFLRDGVFSHGQLYVALSRVRSSEGLKVYLPNADVHTKNIVYRDVLQ